VLKNLSGKLKLLSSVPSTKKKKRKKNPLDRYIHTFYLSICQLMNTELFLPFWHCNSNVAMSMRVKVLWIIFKCLYLFLRSENVFNFYKIDSREVKKNNSRGHRYRIGIVVI
jgi:hypothetical protein